MQLLVLSFFAGILTVLAPCVFTLLPVVIGGSAARSGYKKPLTIIASLSLSVFLFTLLLKASTILIGVDAQVWKTISGGILIVFGLITLFPTVWDRCSHALGFSQKSESLLQSSATKDGFWGDVAVGAALGPVFSSCSPTYAVIVATILPQSFGAGLVYLVAYTLGLAFVLLLIAILGQKLISRMRWAVNPDGWFKKIIGILFILVGVAIFTGLDKTFETWVLTSGYFNLTTFEYGLLTEVSDF